MDDYDIFLETIKYLEIDDIFSLCKTNKKFNSFCQMPETWEFLLNQHPSYFRGKTSDNPRDVYMEFYLGKSLIYPSQGKYAMETGYGMDMIHYDSRAINCLYADDSLLIDAY